MKKIFFLTLLAVLTIADKSHAQEHLVATLDHEGTLSTFTGSNAFVEAHKAATHGDIITLSSGIFAAPDTLTKAITLYGTGIVSDSIHSQTIINTEMILNIPNSEEKRLTIESVYFTSKISYMDVPNPIFNKCRIWNIDYDNNTPSYTMKNASFQQCRISNGITISEASSATFRNCYLASGNSSQYRDSGNISFTNCVISSTGFYYIRNSSFINCFLYTPKATYTNYINLYGGNTANFCVAYSYYSGNTFESIIDNSTDIMVDSLGAVFKTWRGKYSDQETFELTDEAKAKYLGNDGTQIGIYGGALPYDPTPSNPRITKFYLTPKPAEKKLEIQLEAE